MRPKTSIIALLVACADPPRDGEGADSSASAPDSADSADRSAPDALDADDDGADTDVDCDDGDASIHPGAVEHCDGVDEDCDGAVDDDAVDVDESFPDDDGDGYGSLEGISSCTAPPGHIALSGDCDDTDAATHPGAPEVCDDGADNDCVLGGDDACRLSGVTRAIDELDVIDAGELDIESTQVPYGFIESVGDVGGDGEIDLLVGVGSGGDETHGLVLLCAGPLDALTSLDDCSTSITSTTTNSFLFLAGAGLGDIDGDGFDDVAVADPGPFSDSEGIFVFHGPITGATPVADADLTFSASGRLGYALERGPSGDGGPTLLAALPGYATFVLDPGMSGGVDGVVTLQPGTGYSGVAMLYSDDDDYEGAGVVNMGDVNGDGEEDIGVEDIREEAPGAFLVHGTPSGMVDLADADASFSNRISRLGAAGDTDGDGYADVVIQGTPIDAFEPFVFLHLGPVTGDLEIGSASFDASITCLELHGAVQESGFDAIEGVDLDGDALSDLVTTFSGASSGAPAHVLYGPISGAVTEPDLWLASDKNLDDGFANIADLGDADGDGHGDVAFQASHSDEGTVYLLFGSGI